MRIRRQQHLGRKPANWNRRSEPHSPVFIWGDHPSVGSSRFINIEGFTRADRGERDQFARSGKHLAATSFDGGIYPVDPSSLSVVNPLRRMTRRLRPAFAQAWSSRLLPQLYNRGARPALLLRRRVKSRDVRMLRQ